MTQKERLVEILDKCFIDGESRSAQTLADYLLSHGVIVPPCKVGDYVFTVECWFKGEYDPRVVGHRVTSIQMDECDCGEMTVEAESYFGYFVEKDFGKKVFTTRDDALKALNEKQRRNNVVRSICGAKNCKKPDCSKCLDEHLKKLEEAEQALKERET